MGSKRIISCDRFVETVQSVINIISYYYALLPLHVSAITTFAEIAKVMILCGNNLMN